MQFKHPELLYTLFALLIPIIVHLFQLRKFQKVAFTNVAFLKQVTLQTRKSSTIKKWLTLLVRLLIFAAIIIAFAQPYISKNNTLNTKTETVIYLDNSFSLQAKGDKGDLLKRAVQDLITEIPEDESISIITNDKTFRKTTIKAIKNDLLQLDYTANQLNYDAALLKSQTLFSKNESVKKNVVFISDFQQIEKLFNPVSDSLLNIFAVQLKPVNINNIAIDSVFVSNTTATNIELTVNLKNTGNAIDNLPVSLLNNSNLIAKTSVALNGKTSTTFTIPTNEMINGEITIDDANLQFDNTLFFNINKASKINVLAINASNDSFLKRIYSKQEFNYTTTALNQLNYSDLEKQNLIILNELKNIPIALSTALNAFINNGGYILVMPSGDIDIQSYNNFFSKSAITFNTVITSEKKITNINFSHPLYTNVFDKQVRNFQYPKVNSFYNVQAPNASNLLQFEDGKSFLTNSKNVFVFTSALNSDNSNFKNSPLIVPTLYNIAKRSLKLPDLYYTIGRENSFDINTTLQQDDILMLVKDAISMIPQQQYYNNKVAINTNESPATAGIYEIKNKLESIENVSYNYNRVESNLVYQDLSTINTISTNDSIVNLFETLKSDSKINALWKWFVIFALLFLIIEMLILKYLK